MLPDAFLQGSFSKRASRDSQLYEWKKSSLYLHLPSFLPQTHSVAAEVAATTVSPAPTSSTTMLAESLSSALQNAATDIFARGASKGPAVESGVTPEGKAATAALNKMLDGGMYSFRLCPFAPTSLHCQAHRLSSFAPAVVLDIPKLPIVQNTKTSIPLCNSVYNISLLSVEVSNVLVGGLELSTTNPAPSTGRISGEIDGVGLSISAKLQFEPALSGLLCPLGVLNGLDGESSPAFVLQSPCDTFLIVGCNPPPLCLYCSSLLDFAFPSLYSSQTRGAIIQLGPQLESCIRHHSRRPSGC